MDKRAAFGQITDNASLWLKIYWLPAEIRLIILNFISSHEDLISFMENCPGQVETLWQQYPQQLFPLAWDNVLEDIDPDLIGEAIIVYHLRKIRKDYAIARRSCLETETQQDRDGLEDSLRAILSLDDEPTPELERRLETVLDMAKVIRDVNSLTSRYSNDAWERVRGVAKETGTAPGSVPRAIRLTRVERFKFSRAFLRVETYLITKFWTNARDERHILDMDEDIEPYIPDGTLHNPSQRRQFDSCLRYIFHAYRGHLKKTARHLGIPELPTRDDFAWVRNWDENEKYEYKDYPKFETDDPVLNLRQRSISEEQGFLLSLCESGIGPLEQMHQAKPSALCDELVQQFSRRHVWETVELRHRFSRYDDCADYSYPSDSSYATRRRNRHPVMSLYGEDRNQRYIDDAPSWACASAFLKWKSVVSGSTQLYTRENITLNDHGHWVTLAGTDTAPDHRIPFRLRGRVDGAVRSSHP